VSVDYWEFTDAQKATAKSLAAQVESYQAAINDFRGNFARGIDAEWILPYRQDIRREAIVTANRLADQLIAKGQLSRAVDLLHQARALDPHNENTYQKIILAEHELGRPEAAERTYTILREKLEEIGVEPLPATQRMAQSRTR
jgi:DNA-binding SARP family transcriptional activator